MRCHIKKANTYDMAIILDCGDLTRVGAASSTVSRIPIVVNIDHHISNTRFGDIQLIDVNACSTAEIVYRLIKALNAPMDKVSLFKHQSGRLCHQPGDG